MLTTLALLLLIIYLLKRVCYKFLHGNDDFWTKRGVPLVLLNEFSSYFDLLLGKKDIKQLETYYYNKYPDARFVGAMELRNPTLLIRDPELLNKILIKDFDYFVDRRPFDLGSTITEKILGNMHGQAWKEMRMVISPLFTTSKIRRIFFQFEKSSQNMVTYVKKETERNGNSAMDVLDLFKRFAMDVIASIAFGMDSQCLTNNDSIFLEMASSLQSSTWKLLLLSQAPWLARILGVTFFKKEAIDFFKEAIENTIKQREKDGQHHADFLQLMLEVKGGKSDSGIVEDELDEFEKAAQLKQSPHRLSHLSTIDDEGILANSILFFLAGLDGIQSLMTFAAYQLAVSPEIQERLRREVQEVAEEFKGDINYDGLTKMTYLDMFITELTRLYSGATKTDRKTHQDYKIPGSDVVIPAGTIITIPILAIHMDEKHFPNPTKFDPERYANDDKVNRGKILAFGDGPRNCVGKRLALTETKAAIAHLILNFDIEPVAETPIPIKFDAKSLALKPEPGLKISMKPRV